VRRVTPGGTTRTVETYAFSGTSEAIWRIDSSGPATTADVYRYDG
jgi:hypothetical protein